MIEKFLKSRNAKLFSPTGRALTSASVIGLHLVLAVFIGFGIGYGVDRFFGTLPVFSAIFLLLGIVAGFKNMFVQGKRLLAAQEKAEKEIRDAELEKLVRPAGHANSAKSKSPIKSVEPEKSVNRTDSLDEDDW